MAQTKYKQYYDQMVAGNAQLFADFGVAHAEYEQQTLDQAGFNERGRKVVDVVRDWDRRLCSAMGRGAFSKYSEQLSEKFWSQVRKDFPLIDKVGLKP